MYRVRDCVMFLALAASTTACDDAEPDAASPARVSCMDVRARIAELRTADLTVDREQHRRALADGLGDRFLQECERLDEDTRRCVLGAPDHAAADVCLAAAAD